MISWVFLLVLHQIAGGNAADNTTGWAWSDTVGWVSMNSTNDFGFRIQASSDDAYDAPESGWPFSDFTDSEIHAGRTQGQTMYGGWRWTGINIPNGATIQEAYVRLYNAGWGKPVTTNLAFEKNKTPLTFSVTDTPYTRWGSGQITAPIQWDWTMHKEDGGVLGVECGVCWVKTPPLTTQLAEIVALLNPGETLQEVVLLEDGSPTALPPPPEPAPSHSWIAFDLGPTHPRYTEYPDNMARLYVSWTHPTLGSYSNIPNDPQNPEYGVHVDPATGDFSGYAWSENIGWIKFDPTTTPPGEIGATPAVLDLITNQVSGWIRACAAVADKVTCEGPADSNAGGWDGWIKMRDASWAEGVRWNPVTKELEGWAWGGGTTMGWVSFNCENDHDAANAGVQPCTSVGGRDYFVKVSMNVPPTAINLTVTSGNYCTPQPDRFDTPPFAISDPPVFLNWTFSDANALDAQSKWRVEVTPYWEDSPPGPNFTGNTYPQDDWYWNAVSGDYNWTSPDPIGEANNAGSSYPPIGLSYLRNSINPRPYAWRLKVWDSEGAESAWIRGPLILTASNAYPQVSFKPIPANPVVGEEVVFTDYSECYRSQGWIGSENQLYPCRDVNDPNGPGGDPHRYIWDFGDGAVCDSALDAACHPLTNGGFVTHAYAIPTDDLDVSLRIETGVADGAGGIANCTNNFINLYDVTYPLPDWKETHPNP